MARRDRADYAGMSDSQVAVACAVEQARVEARDKARSEFGCIRSQLGEESTWWLCQPPKMRSMAADVAHRGDPMPFEVEGELLESLEILPEERMSKVYRILGQSQGWSLGQGKASVDVEKKIDVTVDVKGVDLGALQPPTLWRLHRYINACFRAEACKELKRSLGFGCVFCGYQVRGCYYCNPRKERRREAKKEVLRLKILATKERLRYLAETYKEEMKKHIKRVTKLGRQTGYMQALEDEARETLGVLEDLKRVQRGFARKVIKDKLVMLSPDKMDQVFHIVVKGGNADALEPSARLMQKINFRALDDATLCEIDKFANECLFPYGDQLSLNLFN